MAGIPDPSKVTAFVSAFLSLFELGGKLFGLGSKLLRGFSSEGMYEIVDYESTLELLDVRGKAAKFSKNMVIRYLQDDIVSFSDFGWSDGQGLLGYKIAPGVPVDRYKSGHRNYVLVSLRQRKTKGETDRFNIEWKIKEGFLLKDGYWQTDVTHKFSKMKLNIIFPKGRPPKKAFVEESNIKRSHTIGHEKYRFLPDGRVRLSWSTGKPRLYEQYIFRWVW
jgi:hypothetical protein